MLADELGGSCDDHLVGGLYGLPRSRGPDVDDCLADGVEDGCGGGVVGGAPPTTIDNVTSIVYRSPPDTGASSVRTWLAEARSANPHGDVWPCGRGVDAQAFVAACVTRPSGSVITFSTSGEAGSTAATMSVQPNGVGHA